jgi:hypothetical protein
MDWTPKITEGAMSKAADEIAKITKASREMAKAQTDVGDRLRANNLMMKDMTKGALSDFAGGMWSVADAALNGGESFGVAMSKMVKSTLMGIASQATIKAVFETAEGFAALSRMDFPAAANAFTSAGIFAAVAAISGGSGLAMGGGSTVAPTAASDYASKQSSGSAYTPSYGKQEKEDSRPMVFNVYLGNKGDIGLKLYNQQQFQMELVRSKN